MHYECIDFYIVEFISRYGFEVVIIKVNKHTINDNT